MTTTNERIESSGARETFGSRFGSMMSLIGIAVGLANVWRFPYMAGHFGGGAFVAAYLLLFFGLGIPALMAELTLGRYTRQGPSGAYGSVGVPGGRAVGGLLFFGIFMSNSYYVLVIGQVLFYASQSLLGSYMSADPQAFFDTHMRGVTPANFFGALVTFGAIAAALYFGVRRGIERVSTIVMPLIFLSLIVVAVRSLTLPGAWEGVRFFLLPDPEKLTGQTLLAALGQVFFSLAVGGTFLLLYGSYLRPDENIPRVAVATGIGDLTASFLGGFAVLPAVFALGLEPSSGPPLLFVTLPGVFARISGGAIIGAIFFGALFFAAYLSAVAAVEVLVDGLKLYLGWGRARSLVVLVAGEMILALPSMASPKYLMWNDLVWGSTMQPIGSLMAMIAVGYFLGRGKALAEINRGSSVRIGYLWVFWVRFVIPVTVVAVLLYGWWERLGTILRGAGH